MPGALDGGLRKEASRERWSGREKAQDRLMVVEGPENGAR